MKKAIISLSSSLVDSGNIQPAEDDLPFIRSRQRRIEAVPTDPRRPARDPDKTVAVQARWTAEEPSESLVDIPAQTLAMAPTIPLNRRRTVARWLVGKPFRGWLAGLGHCLTDEDTPTPLEAMVRLGGADLPIILRPTLDDLIAGQRQGQPLSEALADIGLLADADIRRLVEAEQRGTMPAVLQALSGSPMRPTGTVDHAVVPWTRQHPLCDFVAEILHEALEEDYDEVQVLIDRATGKGVREGFRHHNLVRIDDVPHVITPAIIRILMTLARVPYWTPKQVRGGIQHPDIPGRWLVRAEPGCVRLRRIARAYD